MWAAIEATTLSSAFLVGFTVSVHRWKLHGSTSLFVLLCRFWSVRYRAGIRQRRQRYAQAEMAIFWSEVLKQSSLLDQH